MFNEALKELVRRQGEHLYDKAYEEYKNRQEYFEKVAAQLSDTFNLNCTGKANLVFTKKSYQ